MLRQRPGLRQGGHQGREAAQAGVPDGRHLVLQSGQQALGLAVAQLVPAPAAAVVVIRQETAAWGRGFTE